MNKLLSFIAAASMLGSIASCGGGRTERATVTQDSTEVSFSSDDSVIYGLAGADGTDSVLDLIPQGQNPQYFDIVEARKRGDIIGNFDIGNRVAVVLSADKKRVVKAVDISSLAGRWIKDGIENDSVSEGFNLSSDGSAADISRIHSKMRYVKWDIADADLVITKREMFDKKAKPAYDTFDIVRLQEDTLVLRKKGDKNSAKYILKEFDDGKK